MKSIFRLERFGVVCDESPEYEIIHILTAKLGRELVLRCGRQQVSIWMTARGSLKVGKPHKAGLLRAAGFVK